MNIQEWSTYPIEEIERKLRTSYLYGLSQKAIPTLLTTYGKNVLTGGNRRTVFDRILAQFHSPLVVVLLLAGLATIFLQEYIDALVIFVALTVNIIIGTFQEERASKAFEKLNASIDHTTVVIRDGKRATVPAENVVPGDLVVLEAGAYVPADVRLFKTKDFEVNEAALTGEWIPVPKDADPSVEKMNEQNPLNIAWRGTLVTSGFAQGIVLAIGDQTQMGAIAQQVDTEGGHLTPLQHNIRNIAQFLLYGIAAAIIVIFAVGLLRGDSFAEMLLIAIALAVAAIPEGLPAAVTVTLALGMEKILKKGGLVRNLLAAETLGSTTTVLTDKTGTLTEARMKVSSVHSVGGGIQKIDSVGEDGRYLLRGAVLASDAFVEETHDAADGLVVHGRPVEKAVLIAGLEAGLSQEDLEQTYTKLDFLQFSSERGFAATLVTVPRLKKNRLFMSGAPELFLDAATKIHKNGKAYKMTEKIYEELRAIQKRHSAKGIRLIGVAYRDVSWEEIPECKEDHPACTDAEQVLEKDVVFVGFILLQDPVRVDVVDSIALVKHAGVRVMMITGDNPVTAYAIALETGICKEGARVMTGSEIAHLNDEELFEALQTTAVLARVRPIQKLRIARVLKNNGEIVAMTGDGINDAPALRAAHIGVAVGSGTEVAKEASDLVLINNSFSIIVDAIRLGRNITNNLKKIVAFLISTSFSGIMIIAGALLVGLPLPILPVQILWANIIEEGLMSFAFAFEPEEKGLMEQKPQDRNIREVITPELRNLIILVALVTGAFLILLYIILQRTNLPIGEIRTIMFVALSLDALFFSFALKSLSQPIWRISLWSNRYLLIAFSVSLGLLILALTFPPLQFLLSLTPLSFFDFMILVGVGLFNLLVIEVFKYAFFGRFVPKMVN